jgi:hypothetical protein
VLAVPAYVKEDTPNCNIQKIDTGIELSLHPVNLTYGIRDATKITSISPATSREQLEGHMRVGASRIRDL